jgi:hypothetical protein
MPQFQSFNFRDRFIRHRSFEGVLIRKQDPGGPRPTSLSWSSTEGLAEYRCGPRISRIGSRGIVIFGSCWRSQPGPQISCSGRTQRSFSSPDSQPPTGFPSDHSTSRTVFSVTATSDCSLTHGTARISPPMQPFSGYSSSITAPNSILSTISEDDVDQTGRPLAEALHQAQANLHRSSISDGCAVAWGLLACRPAGDRVAAGAALPDQPPLPRTDRPIRIPQGPDAVGGSSA